MKKRQVEDKKGITLIALVITIVVLIILAGVLINISLGNNGLFNKAKTAKEMYTNAQDYEETEIAKMTNQIDGYVDGNRGKITLTEEQYNAIVNKTVVLDVKSPSNFSWQKVADYPEGFNYDNCYIVSGYVLYGNTVNKYTINSSDSSSWVVNARLTPNGIEMLACYDSGFTNKDAKIILSKF